jgi:hypothetical protein
MLVETFKRIRQQYQALETQHDAIANRLKQLMGEAEGLEAGWGRIDWKQGKPRTDVDWKGALQEVQQALALRASVHPELRALHEELSTILARHTTQKPGNRPFVVRMKEAA